MKYSNRCLGVPVILALSFFPAFGQLITSVTQINGRTDRPSPAWTGQTFLLYNVATPLTNYTVGYFGEDVLSFADRVTEYNGATTLLPLPSYLLGAEYVMVANDNRAQPGYQVDITVSAPVRAYLFVDNRIGDGNGADPPNFPGNTNMAWVVNDGWLPVLNGLNRAGDPTWPDEIGWDETGGGIGVGPGVSINQYGSVYYKDFWVPGTFSTYTLLEGRNMYGVAVTLIPEPSVPFLLSLGLLAMFWARRPSK